MSQELERIAAGRAKEAVYYDRIGQKSKAVKVYREVIEILWRIYSLTTDPTLKKVYQDKIREYQERIDFLTSDSDTIASTPKTTMNDAVLTQKPQVKWDDIVNLEDAKKAIRESIVYPTKRPDLFPLGWPRGILLFGPPGCGKTLLAAAAASEIDASFHILDAATIMSKWLGESERNVSRIFNQCRQAARSGKPAIIFIDEVDSLTAERPLEVGGEARVRNQLLKEMDSILDKGRKDYIYVIAATNKPWLLDEPFIRRFQKRIYVSLPDLASRRRLFEMYTRGLNMDSSVELNQMAIITDGYSASDIHDICMEVQLKVVSEFFSSGGGENGAPRPITMEDFSEVIKRRKPSISLENMKRLLEWQAKHATG
ncbi:ATP-dependent zinc metalloprotease FtsH 4 [archaeon HR01]|nr:ATP-dependent zinc metalloprotease FtsH 4 [archaeon HR01]